MRHFRTQLFGVGDLERCLLSVANQIDIPNAWKKKMTEFISVVLFHWFDGLVRDGFFFVCVQILGAALTDYYVPPVTAVRNSLWQLKEHQNITKKVDVKKVIGRR